MGYLFTGFILSLSAIAIVTIYQIMPDHLRENIAHFIDELGGETR